MADDASQLTVMDCGCLLRSVAALKDENDQKMMVTVNFTGEKALCKEHVRWEAPLHSITFDLNLRYEACHWAKERARLQEDLRWARGGLYVMIALSVLGMVGDCVFFGH